MAAEQIIKVGIEGDAGGLDAGFAQAEKKIDQLADAVKSAEKIISPAINNISEGFKDLGNTKISTKAIADYASAIKSIKNDISGARLTSIFPQNLVPKNTVPDLKNTKKGTVDATYALSNLSRVAQDAPFGFIAIANNLNPLLESFQRLSVEAKNAGQSLGSVLVKSLTGAGGLGLALGAVSAALTLASVGFGAWTRGFGGANKETEKAKKGIADVAQEAKKLSAELAASDISKVETLRTALTDLSIPLNTRNKALEEYNKIADKANQISVTDLGNIGKINAAVNDQISLLKERAVVRGAEEKLKDLYQKLFEQEDAFRTAIGNNSNKTADDIVKGLTEGQKKAIPVMKVQAKKVQEAIKFQPFTPAGQKEANEFAGAFDKIGARAGGFNNAIRDTTIQIGKMFDLIRNAAKNGADFGSVFEGDPKKLKKEIQEKLIDPISEIPFDPPDVFFSKQPEVKLAFEPNKDFAKFVSDKFQNIKIQKPPSFVFPKTTFDFSSFITFTGQQAVADKLAADMKTLGEAATAMFKEIGGGIAEALGNALASAITGGNVQDVFKALFQLIGSSIQSLGKQMIALSPLISAISVAIKSLNPALLLPAGIAMVALGGVIKSLFSKAPGLKTGGIIPPGFPNDTFPAMLSSKEAVIPLDRQGDLFGNAQPIIILNQRLRGRDAVLQQARENKSQRRGG